MNKTWNLKEMKKLIPLALPVLVVNLSIVGMGAVDAIVAGRAGVTDMAAVALGSSVYLPVALFGLRRADDHRPRDCQHAGEKP